MSVKTRSPFLIIPVEIPGRSALAADDRDGLQAAMALVSHEMRTPLNGVLGMAGLLASTDLDATQRAYLQTLADCGEHLLGLVNNALDLAKLDAGGVSMEPAPTDMEDLLQGVAELLSPRAHAQGLEIAWAVSAGAPRVVIDDGRLRQVVFNLMGNAVKMTRQGGVLAVIDVAPSSPGRAKLALTVEDTGPGVPAREAGRIFEPFVQGEAGAVAGGAGLGLAVVRRIADAMGASVGVERAPGGGARFRFDAEVETSTPEMGQGPEPLPLAGVRVHLGAMPDILRRGAELQLLACGAAPATRRADADIVLLDLPRDGTELARPRPGGAPSLVMLAPEERGEIERLRGQGHAGYLIKPLRRRSLAARIRAVLDARANLPADESAEVEADERLADQRLAAAAPTGLRVLLAEDNAVNALLAQALLARAGCSVDRAGSGEEAVSAVGARTYDLILMDVRMPGQGGLAAARAIRAMGCGTPIVALTANAFDEDRRACREAGMDAFLAKPLEPRALAAVLTATQPVTL